MARATDVRLSVDTLHALSVLRDHELARLDLGIELRERILTRPEYERDIKKLDVSKRRARKIFDARLESDLVASARALELALQRRTLLGASPKKKTRRSR